MLEQGTTWQKRAQVIIPMLLGIIIGLLPMAVPVNWFWMFVCWLVWGSCTVWFILKAFSSKTLRIVALIIISIPLLIGGLQRVAEQWLKDHPVPAIVYKLPVNHLPEHHKEPAGEEIAKISPNEPPRDDDVSHQQSPTVEHTAREIRPVVKVNAVLKNVPDHAASYRIRNEGPLDVFQLQIKLLSHKVHKNGEIGSAGYGDQYVEELSPHTTASYDFPEHCLDVPKESAQESVVEIRLTYSYGPDKKKAAKSVFYFVNPKGLRVGELDRTLTPKIYDPIKKSLVEMLKHSDGFEYESNTSDILHRPREQNRNTPHL